MVSELNSRPPGGAKKNLKNLEPQVPEKYFFHTLNFSDAK